MKVITDLLAGKPELLDKRRDLLKSSIEDLNQKRKTALRQYREEQRRLSRLTSQVASMDHKYKALVETKKKLEDYAENLHTQAREIEEIKRDVANRDVSIKRQESQYDLQEQQLKEFADSLKKTEHQLEVKESALDAKFSELQTARVEFQKDKSTYEAMRNELQKKQELVETKLTQLNKLDSELNAQKVRVEERAKNLESDNQALLVKEKTLQEALDKLARDRSVLDSDVARYEENKLHFTQKEKEFNTRYVKVKPIVENMLEYQQKLYDLQHKVKVHAHDVKHFDERKTRLTKEVENLHLKFAQKQKDLEEVQLKIHHAELDLRRLKAEAQTVTMHLKKVDEQLKDRHKHLQKFEDNLLKKDMDLRKKIEDASMAKFKAEQDAMQAKMHHELADQKHKVLETRQSELHKLETKLKNEYVRHAKIKEEMKSFEERLRDVELREIDVGKKETGVKILQEELQKRKKDLVEADNDKNLLQLRAKLSQLMNQEHEWEKESFNLKKELEAAQLKVTSLEDHKNELAEIAKTVHAKDRDIARLQDDIKILKEDNEELVKAEREQRNTDNDPLVKKTLAALDKLMEHLPQDQLDSFVESEDFKILEKVFAKYDIGS